MSLLPSGLVFLASQQVAGRGRGSNTWLSPSGCLQFSLLLRLPVSRSSSIVFVQYLFGLAVVEALRSEKGYEEVGKRVRLKWPNDIYVDMAASNVGGGSRASNDDRWKKIGGILVNSSFMDNEFSLIIGAYLPTTAINSLHLSFFNASSHGKAVILTYLVRLIYESRLRNQQYKLEADDMHL